MNFKKQAEFPFLGRFRFKDKFKIDDKTIFVYKDTIYCDYSLPPDIEAHERRHLERQSKVGADNWIERYLNDKDFRLNEELIAYRAQINYWTNREAKNHCRIEAANNLSSPLYEGVIGIISYAEAFKRLS